MAKDEQGMDRVQASKALPSRFAFHHRDGKEPNRLALESSTKFRSANVLMDSKRNRYRLGLLLEVLFFRQRIFLLMCLLGVIAIQVLALPCSQAAAISNSLPRRVAVPQTASIYSVFFHRFVAQQDEDQLDRYLQRLALSDLRIYHLEDRIAQLTDPVRRNELAQQLADLYADRLFELKDDTAAYEEALSRVEKLLNNFPSANNSSLRVMILQAEYMRGEELVTKWQEDRSDSEITSQARTILTEVSDDFKDELELINQAIARLDTKLADPGLDETQADELTEQIRKQQVIKVRSEYFAGWANYYAGLLVDDGSAKTSYLQQAELSFRRFLEIEPTQELSEVDGEWIDLRSILQTRGLAGLGMAAAALNHVDDAEHLFGVLRQDEVAPQVRNTMVNLELQAWLNAGDLDRAIAIAERFIRSFTSKASREQTRFSVALLRFNATSNVSDQRLTELGIEGLIRQRQFGLLRELNEKLSIDLGLESSFYLDWARGNLHFSEAESTGNRDEYFAAIEDFKSALSSADAQSDARSASHCRYQLAWAMFYTEQFEEAALEFDRVSMVLRDVDQETAANAAWKKYECFQKLSQSEPRFQVQAIESLRSLRISFPDHRLAQSAEIHLSKLERARLSLDESIKQLEAVGTDDPTYRDSRFELCVLYHNVWNQKLTAGESTNSEEKDAIRAVDRFAELSEGMQSEVSRRSKALLLVADIGLRSRPAQLDVTEDYLKRAEAGISTLPPTNNLQAEYHYQRFQLGRLRGDEDLASREADWLIENAPGSAYVLSALVQSAKTLEKQIREASSSDKRGLQLQAKEVYRKMVGVLGSSEETLQSNKNARVALFRLAKLDYDLGRSAASLESIQPLLDLEPDNESYLRYAGLAHHQARSYQQALPYWQRLSQGTKRGSDSWLEAKYYLIDCLRTSDLDQAQTVMKQFRVLYPVGKAGKWEDSFAALEKRLK